MPTPTDNSNFKLLFASSCSCSECQSAVGPLAYLADLLKYCLNHVKLFPSGGGTSPLSPITLEYFEEQFYQPFKELTFSCEQMNKKVCQIRAAIETLNRYVSVSGNTETGNRLDEDRQAYCFKTYSDILIQLGISYEELRNIQNGTDEDQTQMADRLRIPLTPGANNQLTRLFLDNTSADMTEANIEKLFGIVDTANDPFNNGLKEGDSSGKLIKWYFNGYRWGENTDEEGFIYIQIDTTPSPDKVYVYKDSSRTQKVAEGYVDAVSLIVKLTPYAQSGLSGILQLKTGYTADTGISISLLPLFLSWQFRYLHQNVWKSLDYSVKGSNYIDKIPCIDPDIISLEDIRNPYVTAGFNINGSVTSADTAANLWNKRSKLLTGKKDDIKAAKEGAADANLTTETLSSPVAQTLAGVHLFVLNKTAADAGHMVVNQDISSSPGSSYLPLTGSFSNPEGLTHYMLGTNPILLIADTGNNQIKRRDDGSTTIAIGTTSTGTKLGLFNAPKDVAVDKSNNLFVADGGNNRIQVLNMGWLNTYKISSAIAPDGPKSIKADKYGNIYIADSTMHRILKYDAAGGLVWDIGKRTGGTPVSGTGDLEFDSPAGIAVDNEGNVYVSDTGNSRVQKISDAGVFVSKWGTTGSGNAQLNSPTGLCFYQKANGDRLVLVADKTNQRVQIFNSEGEYQNTLGTTGSTGTDNSHFNTPVDVAVDSDGYIYIADQGNKRVQKFNAQLGHSATWDSYTSEGVSYVFTPSGIYIDVTNAVYISVKDEINSTPPSTHTHPAVVRTTAANGTSGSGDAQRWGDGDAGNIFTNALGNPLGLGVDGDGFVLVADGSSSAKIHKFKMPYAIGGSGTGDGQLSGPTGIALAPDGSLYVVDAGNNRIQQFHLNGTFIRKWNTKKVSGSNVNLNGLYKIYADTWGYVYITENNTSGSGVHAIHKYDNTGNFLRTLSGYGNAPTSFAGTSSIISTPDNQDLFVTDYTGGGSQKLIRLNQLHGLGAAVSVGLGTDLQTLVDLRNTRLGGNEEEFEAGLESLALDKPTFNYLLGFVETANRVPSATNILDSEWDSVYDILLRSYKIRTWYLAATASDTGWKKQEFNSGIVLSPSLFNIRSAAAESEVVLNPWRATRKERKNLVKELKARKQQMDAVVSDLEKIISDVQDTNLQLLRDALLRAAKYSATSNTDSLTTKANEMGRRLFIDMENNCCSKTTRVAQAMEVLQGFITSIRNGLISDIFPLLTIDGDHFDEQWEWIGSYEKWRSGMFVSLYPENILLPQLKENKSGAFKKLLKESGGNLRFNPAQATQLERDFEAYINAITNLRVQSACLAYTDSNQERYYYFATALTAEVETWAVYWSSASPENTDRSTWEEVPGTAGKARHIIGSEVYRNNKDERHLYLFLRVKSGADEKFAIQRHNLATGEWDDECTEVGDDLGKATVILRQRYGGPLENQPPQFAVASHNGLRTVSLTKDGMDIEADPIVIMDIYQIGHPEKQKRNDLLNAALGGVIGYKMGWIRSGPTWAIDSELYPLFVKQVHAYIKVNDNWDAFITHHRDVTSSNTAKASAVYGHIPYIILTNNKTPGSSSKIPLRGLNNKYAFVSAFRRPGTTTILSLWRNLDDGSLKIHLLVSSSGTVTLNQAYPAGVAYKGPDDLSLKYSKPYRRDEAGDSSTEITLLTELNKTSTLRTFLFKFSTSSTSQVCKKKVTLHLERDAGFSHLQTGADRAARIKASYEGNINAPLADIRALDEYFYFVPMQVAMQLQKRGFYQEALDRYRLVYDYRLQPEQRKIYYGLVREENYTNLVSGSSDWIDTPLNPHAVAVQRTNSYSRFTLLTIARCMIEYADSEFTRDNAESNPRARTLYESAIQLLQDPVLTPAAESDCSALLKQLDARDPVFTQSDTQQWNAQWHDLKKQVAHVKDITLLGSVVDTIINSYITSGIAAIDIPLGLADSYNEVAGALAQEQTLPSYQSIADTSLSKFKEATRLTLKAEGVMNSLAQTIVQKSKQKLFNRVTRLTGLTKAFLSQNTGVTSAGHPWLGKAVLLNPPAFNYAAPVALTTAYTAATESFAPSYLAVNTVDMTRPTGPAVLAQITAQATVNILFTKPPRDAESNPNMGSVLSTYYSQFVGCLPPNPVKFYYTLYAEMNLFKMRNCMNIAGVQRELDPYAAPTDTTSGLPYIGIGGQLQYAGTPKYNPSLYRYDTLIERAKQLAGLAQQMEGAMLAALEKRDAEDYSRQKAKQELQLGRQNVKLNNLRVKTVEEEVKLAELQKERSEFMEDFYSELLAAGLTVGEMANITALNSAAAIFLGELDQAEGAGHALSATAQALSQMASYARRTQEWQFQRGLASRDVKIGGQQVKIANSRLRVSGQELHIAEMQADFADDSLNFLEKKFTNTELYEWMSDVLSGVYMTFLQLATATAKAAQDQLAFERQETPLTLIRDNYWEQPQVPGDTKQPDRRGLTGSASLLQDIYLLDQNAFDKDQRKNELTKTFSLASLNPVAFAEFRNTGILKFSTPLENFDRDFPGQYLRLIKKVRTSVIALIPPTQGIRAKLIHGGISTVQVKNNQAIIERELKRLPESVTLTSAENATGLFEMQNVNAKLNPFEGSGVAVSAWEFQMPKPANPFDYSTIADVLLTIEYTSLDDSVFRAKLIKQFNNDPDSGERMSMYSFRNDFADQWYELVNQANPAEACSITFNTLLADFPANMNDKTLQGVAFYFSRKDGSIGEAVLSGLTFTPGSTPETPIIYAITNGDKPLGSVKGRISSKDNTGAPLAMFSKVTVAGEWQLRLRDTYLFHNGEIEDLIFVAYYSGDNLSWPKEMM